MPFVDEHYREEGQMLLDHLSVRDIKPVYAHVHSLPRIQSATLELVSASSSRKASCNLCMWFMLAIMGVGTHCAGVAFGT